MNDAAESAIARYLAAVSAHDARALRLPEHSAARRAHRRAALAARTALAAECFEIAATTKEHSR